MDSKKYRRTEEAQTTMMVGLELERTIDSIMADLWPYMRTIFKELATTNPENASILPDFIIVEQSN